MSRSRESSDKIVGDTILSRSVSAGVHANGGTVCMCGIILCGVCIHLYTHMIILCTIDN